MLIQVLPGVNLMQGHQSKHGKRYADGVTASSGAYQEMEGCVCADKRPRSVRRNGQACLQHEHATFSAIRCLMCIVQQQHSAKARDRYRSDHSIAVSALLLSS